MQERNWGHGWAGWAALVLSCGCGGESIEHAAEAGVGGAAGGLHKGATSALDAGHGGSVTAATSMPSCLSNDLVIAYAPDMYSAYIPGSSHLFELPVLAQGAVGAMARWSASDPTMVKIDPDPAGGMMLTMQRAGEVVITANAHGHCGTSTLHIDAATEQQWEAGNARYNDMYPLPRFETDGGVPVNLTNAVVDPPGMPPACTNCHADTAGCTALRTITPTSAIAGGFSDQQLIDIFTKGTVPMDVEFYLGEYGIPAPTWSALHTWSDISGEQAQDMVVYLRSLRPIPESSEPDIPCSRPLRKSNSGAGGAHDARGGPDSGASDSGAEAGQ